MQQQRKWLRSHAGTDPYPHFDAITDGDRHSHGVSDSDPNAGALANPQPDPDHRSAGVVRGRQLRRQRQAVRAHR